jgi:endonuclease/exonuclease/phosphatase family metal-dependent hydrolase
MATINVRGWNSYSSRRDVDDMIDSWSDPDVVVLTETKRSRQMQLPRAMHKQYCAFESRRADRSAGVAVLIKRQWCAVDAAHHVPAPKHCRGYVVHVRLQPHGGRAVHVLGVYMPGGAEHKEPRAAIRAHLDEVLAGAAPDATVLLTGDWNACLHDTDRQGQPTTCDREHRRWAAQQPRLASVYGPGQRAPTFSMGGMGASPSMIDDTLVRPPIDVSAGTNLVAGCGIQQHGWATDHALLRCDVDLSVAGVEIPTPQPPARRRPAHKLLPATDAERQLFERRLLDENAGPIARLAERLMRLQLEVDAHAAGLAPLDAREVHTLSKLEGRAAGDAIEDIAAELMAVLADGAQRIAPEVCRVQVLNPDGLHRRPQAVGKYRRRVVAAIAAARAAAAPRAGRGAA